MCEDDRLAYLLNLVKIQRFEETLWLYRDDEKLGFSTRSYKVENSSALAKLYSAVLETLPEDDIELMGLSTLLHRSNAPSLVGNIVHYPLCFRVNLKYVVAWVNMSILQAYGESVRGKNVDIGNAHKQIVRMLGETVGLQALRRILTTLSYYAENTPRDGSEEDETSIALAQHNHH